jgi:hypothetical protein
MNAMDEWKELVAEVKFFAFFALEGLIDTIYVAVWALIQVFFGQLGDPGNLPTIDKGVNLALRILMGIATTVPVAIWIYKDIRIMWIRTQKRIQRETTVVGKRK